MKFPKLTGDDRPADVTLLLEGTYPYVRGGVSSWVHQLMHGLPELRFAIIFLGGRRSDYGEVKYALPPNLVHVEVHFLMGSWRKIGDQRVRGNARAYALNHSLHEGFKSGNWAQAQQTLADVADLLGKRDGLTRKDFLYSREAWDQIGDYYERYCTDPSFVHYFWTVRTMHAPLFDLADIVDNMPPTRLVHSVSTGYAGFLGALAHQRLNVPFVLTEHGIYTKERRIDLAQADWIKDVEDPVSSTFEQDVSYVRQMWIRFFEGLGHMTYQSASSVTSLYEGNRLQQQRDGALPARCSVIPNGIDVERYSAAYRARGAEIPPVIGLIGRIVSIKDIKTFIRSMRVICGRMPEAQGWIVGPTDEDERYAEECKSLVVSLGLENQVKFLGFQKVDEILPQLGLIMLSSISEAQPLVVLEGFAAGVPVVTTDVGCCSELIFGVDDADRALGAAGDVVPIASPVPLAEAALGLLQSTERWQHAQQAALARVKTYYTQALMFERYEDLYVRTMRVDENGGKHRLTSATVGEGD